MDADLYQQALLEAIVRLEKISDLVNGCPNADDLSEAYYQAYSGHIRRALDSLRTTAKSDLEETTDDRS